MVDSSMESRQSDQDDDSDEYPPDESQTKRIEEVSERCLRFWSRRSFTLFPSMRKTNILPIDSSQMGNGGTRTEKDSPGIRFFR